jgi:hypothetical protein
VKLAWARRLSGAVASLVVWSLHFVAVYALVGVGCARGWHLAPIAGSNALTFWLIAATIPALALIAWIGWIGWRSIRASRAAAAHARDEPASATSSGGPRRGDATSTKTPLGVASLSAATDDLAAAKRTRFLGALTLALAGIAFVATVMTAVPIFMLPPCE